MSITAMSTLLADRYSLNETQIGLAFIANGVGSIIGTVTTGRILDVDYRRAKVKHESHLDQADPMPGPGPDSSPPNTENRFPIERARLRIIPVFALLQCMAIVVFGWTVQHPNKVHVAVPIASTFITGWAAVSTQSAIMTYLVDVFPDRSAATSASLNLARCRLAAGGTSFIMPMVNGIRVGWAFTICVAVQITALVCLAVQWKYAGEREDASGVRKGTRRKRTRGRWPVMSSTARDHRKQSCY
ncbi:major facilitator superfamily domain-containing protein [Xylariaceae sp. FL0016]|nr:major facilitator superfamily domain-containing protein [Xylariaceae sp. FL0016]